MVELYSRKLLSFLSALHGVRSYEGVEALHRSLPESAPGMRTLYRWQDSLGDALQFFPSVRFSALGLAHVHLFIERASPRWFSLPFAISHAWLVPRLGERVLYLHCLVPSSYVDAFQSLLKEIHSHGLCRRIFSIRSVDGWQDFGQLDGWFDSRGRLSCPPNASLVWETPRDSSAPLLEDSVLEQYPLVVPVVFEHLGHRRSLNELWQRIRVCLGKEVWRYLPRRLKRWPVNGKSHVKRALQVMDSSGLFRQLRVEYRPLLQGALEVWLLVRMEPEMMSEFLGRLGSVAPMLEVFPGIERRTLVRVTGGPSLMYELFSLFPDGSDMTVEWFFFDKEQTRGSSEEVRFAYELLFDPVKNEWRFPRDEILQCMGLDGGLSE